MTTAKRLPFYELVELYKRLNQRSKQSLRRKFNQFFGLTEESEVFVRLMNERLEVTFEEYNYLAEQIPQIYEFIQWHRSQRKRETA